MKRALWMLAAAATLAAQPKLLVNAATDTRSAAAGLEPAYRALLAAEPQPAWIGYSVPAARNAGLGCEYVRDSGAGAGIVHLEPPTEAIVLLRVENRAVTRVRALSSYCEIDAGGLPVHWLSDVRLAESVALLDSLVPEALFAIAAHADPSAMRSLARHAASDQPESLRLRAISALGRRSGADVVALLSGIAEKDASSSVRRRAMSALQNMPNGEGVAALIQLARSGRDAEARKQAMQALQHSRDPRAAAFFEEFLRGSK